jgi:hypothetical protein
MDEDRDLDRRALEATLDAFLLLSWAMIVLGAAVCLSALGVIGSRERSAGALLGLAIAAAGTGARWWHGRTAGRSDR